MSISTMSIIYLVLFVTMSVIHLYASLKNDQYFRALTKSTLILLLLGFYLESTGIVIMTLVFALLFSWLGDLFLLGKGLKWFTAGGIAFIVSHLMFIATYCNYIYWESVPVAVMIVLAAIFAVAVCIVFKNLKQYLMPQIVVPMFLYLLVNGAMNCFALYRLIGNFCMGSAITAIGAILFFVSDTALFFVRFNKNSVMKSHFLVMCTYLLGEFLIVFGLLFA